MVSSSISKTGTFAALLTRTFFVLYDLAIAAFILLILYTNVPLWFDIRSGTIITPTVYLVLLLCPLPYLLRERTKSFSLIKHPYFWWCLFVLCLHLLGWYRAQYFAGSQFDIGVAIDKSTKFLLAPAFAYLVYSISRQTFNLFLNALIIIGPLLIIYGFLDPGLYADKGDVKTLVAGRSGGPWFNSNIGAEAIVLALIMARNTAPKYLFAVAYILAGIALISTGSRGGMSAWLIFGALFIYSKSLPRVFLLTPIILIVFYSSILVFVEDLVRSIPEQAQGAENLIARLQFMTGTESLEEGGGDQRLLLMTNAFKESLERPILGHGYDFSDDVIDGGAGSHNMLLQLWYLHGVLGVIAWFWVCFLLWRYSQRDGWFSLSLFAFVWFSMFSHNIIEYNLWFIFFAISIFSHHKSSYVDATVKFRRSSGKSKQATTHRRRKRKRRSDSSLSGRKWSW